MESTEKALVLKVGRFREVDAWVRLFSPRKGIFNAFAFGGSVSRRRFLGCLDPFNLVAFKVKTDTAKGYTYLLEGSLIASHPRLRQDGERLGMAVNCVKFLEAAHLGPSGSEPAFELLLATLAVLDQDADPSRMLPLFYRARTAFDQGFRPELGFCARCGADLSGLRASDAPMREFDAAIPADAPPPARVPQPGKTGHLPALFMVEQGKLFCEECRRWSKGGGVALSEESLRVLRAVRSLPPDQWSSLVLSARARMECGRALDAFVEHHLGLTWDHGSFRRI